jgi:hypothetical protein
MKNLIAQQLDEVLANADGRAGIACEGQLWAGAATVSGTDADEITAATVVGAIGRGERDELRALVEAIADELDVQACVRFGAASMFSVRFSARTTPTEPAPPVGAAGPRSAWAHIAGGLFSRNHHSRSAASLSTEGK